MSQDFISRVDHNRLSRPLQEAIDRAKERGQGTRFFESLGHNPELFNWYVDSFYNDFFYKSKLEASIKELFRLKLSKIHGCQFCNKGNTQAALSAGITQDKINHLENIEEGPYSEREKCALHLATSLSLQNTKGQISIGLQARLKQAFSEAELLEMGMLMSILSGIAKYLFAFELVEKEPYCQF